MRQKKHEPATGDWLLELNEFKEWRDRNSGVLWLHGIPGAGKTVLSSTVVEHLKTYVKDKETEARIAYYCFDFNDHAKQTAQGCVQSLVKQVFEQSYDVSDALRSCYNDTPHETPSLVKLVEVLIAMLNDGPKTFLVIDALDECKEHDNERERTAFYEALQELKSNTDGKYYTYSSSLVGQNRIFSGS